MWVNVVNFEVVSIMIRPSRSKKRMNAERRRVPSIVLGRRIPQVLVKLSSSIIITELVENGIS